MLSLTSTPNPHLSLSPSSMSASTIPSTVSGTGSIWSHLPPIDTQTTRVILVRHGRSTFNDQQRYQGGSDEAVLNEKGWRQARHIGHALKSESIDAIYASPLQRVQQTVQGMLSAWPSTSSQESERSHSRSVPAGIVVAEHPQTPVVPLHIRDHLREIHLPGWEGRLYREIREQDADAYQCWVQRPHEFHMSLGHYDSVTPHQPSNTYSQSQTPPHTYPVLELYRRAETFWRETLPLHAGETVVVVGHGGTNHALISSALGLAPQFHHRLQQSNGGISVLDYSHVTRTSQLQALNLTQHLGETLPKLKAGKHGLRLLLLPIVPGMPLALEQIAERLQAIPINYSLTQSGGTAQVVTHQLLHARPDVVQLQVQQEHISAQWHQALEHATQSPGLTTGLAIAPLETIHQLIAATIRLSSQAFNELVLAPGTLSVLHYPAGDHAPILQAMNLG